jgi:signal peptidase II
MTKHETSAWRRAAVFCFVLVACVSCDHVSKRAAEALLVRSGGLSLAGDTVQFRLASNPGAFLSLGAELPEPVRQVLLMGLVPLLMALVCLYFATSVRASRAQWLALALLSGGGIGNWLDRVLHDGAVTDFVSIGLGSLRTGIFNLADLAVVAGVCILLVFRGHAGEEPPAQAR